MSRPHDRRGRQFLKYSASADMRAALAKHQPLLWLSMQTICKGPKRVFMAIILMIAGAKNYIFGQLALGDPPVRDHVVQSDNGVMCDKANARTASASMLDVSMLMASSAGRNGAADRDLSRLLRSCISVRTSRNITDCPA